MSQNELEVIDGRLIVAARTAEEAVQIVARAVGAWYLDLEATPVRDEIFAVAPRSTGGAPVAMWADPTPEAIDIASQVADIVIVRHWGQPYTPPEGMRLTHVRKREAYYVHRVSPITGRGIDLLGQRASRGLPRTWVGACTYAVYA